MAEWQRIANTTIHQYIREEEENILRNRKVFAMMKDRGRISFNHSGDLMDWKVRYKRAPMRVYRESDTLTFSRINRWKTAQIDWRGYSATDSINKFEKLKNKGTEAIINVFSQMAENLMADIEENFCDELYIDGNAAGNTGRLHGFESWFGNSGTQTAGYVATPSDTYAGLSTILGNYGGSWSTSGGNVNWPDGTGDPEYDFWSPMLVDYTDTAWKATTKTWPNTCGEVIRYAIIHGQRNKSKKGMLDMILLERELYRDWLDFQEAKERINVTKGGKGSLTSLGFGDVFNLDGTDITWEYGVPTAVGYGLCMAHLELCSLQSQLFVAETPDFDISTKSDRFSVDFFGNLRANPRYMTKFASYT